MVLELNETKHLTDLFFETSNFYLSIWTNSSDTIDTNCFVQPNLVQDMVFEKFVNDVFSRLGQPAA